jgi:NADPH-dependent curcumin reductase CurA
LNAQKIVLARRPVGMPQPSDFRIESVELPGLKPGQVMLQTVFVSVDPYMRGRMAGLSEPAPPYGIGDVITGAVIARVLDSRHPEAKNGELVRAGYGWQSHAVVDGSDLTPIETDPLPPSTALGVLGSTGLTGYLGMMEVGRPTLGETVVVSAAAGAVGSVAGQTARLAGARVVGIAGSDEKCARLCEQMGFAAAINYHADHFPNALLKACPTGVDVYFDNVGGDVSNAVLPLINVGARIAVCGQISQYNLARPQPTPAIPTLLLNRGAVMKGVQIMAFRAQYAAARAQLAQWVISGKLHYAETILDGFDRIVPAFGMLFTGKNIGKLVVRLSD